MTTDASATKPQVISTGEATAILPLRSKKGKPIAVIGTPKIFAEVLRSVEQAGLASPVADLKARFVIKDADQSLGGAA